MATAPEEPPGIQGPSGCKYDFIKHNISCSVFAQFPQEPMFIIKFINIAFQN